MARLFRVRVPGRRRDPTQRRRHAYQGPSKIGAGMPRSQRPEHPEMGQTTTERWEKRRRASCPSRGREGARRGRKLAGRLDGERQSTPPGRYERPGAERLPLWTATPRSVRPIVAQHHSGRAPCPGLPHLAAAEVVSLVRTRNRKPRPLADRSGARHVQRKREQVRTLAAPPRHTFARLTGARMAGMHTGQPRMPCQASLMPARTFGSTSPGGRDQRRPIG